jgi:hypothetical protein
MKPSGNRTSGIGTFSLSCENGGIAARLNFPLGGGYCSVADYFGWNGGMRSGD